MSMPNVTANGFQWNGLSMYPYLSCYVHQEPLLTPILPSMSVYPLSLALRSLRSPKRIHKHACTEHTWYKTHIPAYAVCTTHTNCISSYARWRIVQYLSVRLRWPSATLDIIHMPAGAHIPVYATYTLRTVFVSICTPPFSTWKLAVPEATHIPAELISAILLT